MSWSDSGAFGYLSFRISTHLDYHRADIDPQVRDELMGRAVEFVQDHPTSVLSAYSNGESLLELGIRYPISVTFETNFSGTLIDHQTARQWTGFGAPRDKPAALAKWTALVSAEEGVPPSLRARAYSCLAKGWLNRAENGLSTATSHFIRRLYDAGNCANQAIALGLASRATLKVAEKIQSEGFRRPEDNKLPRRSTEKFERLTDLWEALDVWEAEVAAKKSKREAGLSREPLGYFCAAEDCGIEVEKKYVLKSCAGGCPRMLKPHYCSKACQTAVRFPSHTPSNRTDLSCRIGSTINRSADRMLQYRVSFRLTVLTWLTSSGDRVPKRMQFPKGSNWM